MLTVSLYLASSAAAIVIDAGQHNGYVFAVTYILLSILLTNTQVMHIKFLILNLAGPLFYLKVWCGVMCSIMHPIIVSAIYINPLSSQPRACQRRSCWWIEFSNKLLIESCSVLEIVRTRDIL
ncbi:uncharacterized protein BJ212DRAFT_423235 [Suillus subaureus]|uniref:Uncharacterized protein n=1 Tax=Suillus subaureus TaxID=48587 RepID=A0A9P7E789_9AGAM|nr:uncharacterized protein BJ212DRAFT_423235 [Suillus subaureus]KAG1813271.1 hypothetical protein BJ212DRAFT_423235 [Suillus subaureus]